MSNTFTSGIKPCSLEKLVKEIYYVKLVLWEEVNIVQMEMHEKIEQREMNEK